MKPLIDRIREAGEFDELYAKSLCSGPLDKDIAKIVLFAMEHQHAQMQWMCEALVDCVKTLDYYARHDHHLKSTAPNFARQQLEEIAALVPKGEK